MPILYIVVVSTRNLRLIYVSRFIWCFIILFAYTGYFPGHMQIAMIDLFIVHISALRHRLKSRVGYFLYFIENT